MGPGREGSSRGRLRTRHRGFHYAAGGARCPGVGHKAQAGGGERVTLWKEELFTARCSCTRTHFPWEEKRKTTRNTYHVPKFNGGNLGLNDGPESPEEMGREGKPVRTEAGRAVRRGPGCHSLPGGRSDSAGCRGQHAPARVAGALGQSSPPPAGGPEGVKPRQPVPCWAHGPTLTGPTRGPWRPCW